MVRSAAVPVEGPNGCTTTEADCNALKNQKTRPRYSQDGAIDAGEPVSALFDGEAVGGLAEFLKFLGSALQPCCEGKAEIQAEHFHEALTVDPVTDIAHINRKMLGGSQSDKFLYILYRCKLNFKFHSKVPRKLYKLKYFMYNISKARSGTGLNDADYSAFDLKFQLDVLTINTKTEHDYWWN